MAKDDHAELGQKVDDYRYQRPFSRNYSVGLNKRKERLQIMER